MDSHKHANTSIYERAYEMDPSHKHANTSIYMSVLMRGILIRLNLFEPGSTWQYFLILVNGFCT